MKTDLELQKDVMEELKWAPLVNASEIGVAVKNGVVTLSGTVDSYTKKYEAETAAKKVAGVRGIAEDIVVQISPDGKRTDAEIAEAVLHALKWNSAVPEERIKVRVEDGVVSLDGEVEWEYERNTAKKAVISLLGVRALYNNIKVTPKITLSLSPEKIRTIIVTALHRRASKDAQRIKVETKGSKVILSGVVHSHSEKEDAEHAAWSIPGVVWVENNLEVELNEIVAYGV